MKHVWKVWTTLITVLLLVGVSQAQQQRFKVYGFTDLLINEVKYESNNNPLLDLTLYNEGPQMGVDHINLYFDFTPNENTRALAEISYSQNVVQDVIATPGERPAHIKLSDGSLMTLATVDLYVDQMAAFIASQGGALDPLTDATLRATYKALLATDVDAADNSQNNEFEIERIWFDVYFHELFNLRIGKFITPAGLWNVDHGSPVIIPVSQPYQTTVIPIFPEKQTGFMAYGATYLGDHELSYNAWATSGREEAGTSEKPLLENTIEGPGHLSYGAHTALATDGILDQLKVGLSYHYGLTRKTVKTKHFELDATDIQSFGTEINTAYYYFEQEELEQRRENIVGVDLSLEHMNVLLKGEFNYRSDENELTGKSTTFTGYYGLLGYNFFLTDDITLTPFTMYEKVSWEDIKNNPNIAIIYIPFEGFATTRFGAKIGLYSNVFMKLEYTMTDILPRDVVLNPGGAGAPAITRKYTDKEMDVTSWSAQFGVAF